MLASALSLLLPLYACSPLVTHAHTHAYTYLHPQIIHSSSLVPPWQAAADNNPSGKWFLQGGSYNISKAEFTWNAKGDSAFAVDCQTWAIAVLGVKQVGRGWA